MTEYDPARSSQMPACRSRRAFPFNAMSLKISRPSASDYSAWTNCMTSKVQWPGSRKRWTVFFRAFFVFCFLFCGGWAYCSSSRLHRQGESEICRRAVRTVWALAVVGEFVQVFANVGF